MLDKWKDTNDKGGFVCVIFMDLSKVTNYHLQMFLNYLELFTGFAEQFIMVL